MRATRAAQWNKALFFAPAEELRGLRFVGLAWSSRAMSKVHTFVEVQTLAGSRGYTLFNLGADHYWLVEKATKVPELNEAEHTLTFSLDQAWAFVDGQR